MTQKNASKIKIIVIAIITVTLLIQNASSINSNIPTPTPNPYGLDSDGYYIADPTEHPMDGDPNNIFNICFDKKYNIVYTEDTSVISVKQFLNNSCSINVENPTFRSNETLIINGTSTLPPNTLITLTIANNKTKNRPLYQQFSAPTLPPKNQNTSTKSIIKIKIPAINIHIEGVESYNDVNYTINPKYFKNNTPINSTLNFGYKTIPITIIYDTNHPLIIESNELNNDPPMSPGGPRIHGCILNYWMWTNTEHPIYTWVNSNYYNRNINHQAIKPYPTFPKPAQSW